MANTRNNDYSKQENCGGMNQKNGMENSQRNSSRNQERNSQKNSSRNNRTAIAMQMKNTVIKRQNPGRQDDALYIYTEERGS